MKKAFIFHDEKSHKFWTIDYDSNDTCFAVNYGKAGTTGKYEIKEADSAEQSFKEAEKLIASKLKKGYREDLDFDFNEHFYFDDEEYGLHPKTSHPKFVMHFTEAFYYDCCDEETPFGSDEGSDTLALVSEQLRKRPAFPIQDYPRYLVEKEWGMEYIPVTPFDPQQLAQLNKEKLMDMEQSDMVTYATAFAQIKITGSLDANLKQAAVAAIRRFALLMGHGITPIQYKMIEDLESFRG